MNVTQKAVDCWKKIAPAIDPTEKPFGSPQAGEILGMTAPAAARYLRFFRGLGLLSYRSEFGTGKGGGQIIYTKRDQSLEEGVTTIYKHFDAGRPLSYFDGQRTPTSGWGVHDRKLAEAHATGAKVPEEKKIDRVALAAEKSPEVTRAMAGPEPESPMKALAPLRRDEQMALIEAARQYANRTTEVQKHIESLASLGVEVDIEAIMKGIKLTVDDRLETISTVLPELDRRQTVIERLTVENGALRNDLTNLRREAEELRRTNGSLKRANERMAEQKVAEVVAVRA